jgi:hypothetical protein
MGVTQIILEWMEINVLKWHGHSVIWGLHSNVDEHWALLGHYAASSVDFLPTFRDNISIPSSRLNHDETERLSRNVGKKLTLLAA